MKPGQPWAPESTSYSSQPSGTCFPAACSSPWEPTGPGHTPSPPASGHARVTWTAGQDVAGPSSGAVGGHDPGLLAWPCLSNSETLVAVDSLRSGPAASWLWAPSAGKGQASAALSCPPAHRGLDICVPEPAHHGQPCGPL